MEVEGHKTLNAYKVVNDSGQIAYDWSGIEYSPSSAMEAFKATDWYERNKNYRAFYTNHFCTTVRIVEQN